MHAIARHEVDNEAFVALGYAGWDAGQLEQEIIDNAWLTVAIDPKIIFSTEIDKRWETALKLLGVSADNLCSFAGHA